MNLCIRKKSDMKNNRNTLIAIQGILAVMVMIVPFSGPAQALCLFCQATGLKIFLLFCAKIVNTKNHTV